MSVDLSQYCEFDEVRAALGVNDLELSDAVLSLRVYLIGLRRELNKISTGLPSLLEILYGKDFNNLTPAEANVVDSARVFSVYVVARQVGVSLATIAAKDITDGKASTSRFSDSPYRDVLTRVDDQLAMARAELDSAYAALTLTDSNEADLLVPGVIFSAGRRTYDPVTGS